MMKCRLILLAFIFTAFTVQANGIVDKEKVIKKSYSIESDGTVDISNKYGDVQILTGGGNQVEIEVKIIVDTDNEKKALEIYERVEIEFSNSSSKVSATTSIDDNSKWWKGWWNKGSKFEINYKVTMPATAHLVVANKYGNTYSESLENGADVSIKYGKVEMQDVKGRLNVEMKYSKGTIASGGSGDIYVGYGSLKMNSIGDVIMDLSYSTFEVQEAGDIHLDMKYGNLTVGKMRNLIAESKYDNIKIEELNELQFESKFTSLTVNRLNSKAHLEMGYGSAKLYHIQPNFNEIKIYTKYTGVKLGFATEASYQVDVESKHSSLKHSGLETTIDIRDNSERTLKGYHGNKNSGIVYARMNYGGLTFE